MAIEHMTYLDLTPEQRKRGAEKARQRLQSALLSPWLTADQNAALRKQLEHLAKWERGEIEVPKPEAPKPEAPAATPPNEHAAKKAAPPGQAHTVSVSESVKLKEKGG